MPSACRTGRWHIAALALMTIALGSGQKASAAAQPGYHAAASSGAAQAQSAAVKDPVICNPGDCVIEPGGKTKADWWVTCTFGGQPIDQLATVEVESGVPPGGRVTFVPNPVVMTPDNQPTPFKLVFHTSSKTPVGEYSVFVKITFDDGCGVLTHQGPSVFEVVKEKKDVDTLWSFTCGSDGCHPYAGVIGDGGTLFGTNVGGGSGTCPPKDAVFGCGVVYQLTPPAAGAAATESWVETTLHDFSGGADGGKPIGGLLRIGKAFYGTTYYGGATGNGVVFRVIPSDRPKKPAKFDVVHNFCSEQHCVDGANPQGTLISDGTSLFGTASVGGVGTGVVFSLSIPQEGQTEGDYTVLKTFPLGGEQISGGIPLAGLLIGGGGKLYGTTSAGGEFDNGEVFELAQRPSPAGAKAKEWKETVLYSFTGGADGGQPLSALVRDNAGNLYGTTFLGGSGPCSLNGNGCGVVYRLSPSPAASRSKTWTYSVLNDFTGALDGARPVTGVALGGPGEVFGAATFGGVPSQVPGVGFGVVFKLTEPGNKKTPWKETVLHSFTGGVDGAFPRPDVLLLDGGQIYGTTYGGGTSRNSGGVVFRLP
jgi:uncharacterized repeat protein (TIGR03803 family)